jgi:hypothetical protein
MCAAIASTGAWLRWQSNNPLIKCRLPGPHDPAQRACDAFGIGAFAVETEGIKEAIVRNRPAHRTPGYDLCLIVEPDDALRDRADQRGIRGAGLAARRTAEPDDRRADHADGDRAILRAAAAPGHQQQG